MRRSRLETGARARHILSGFYGFGLNYAEWLDAIWRGRIDARDLRNPGAADVSTVLDHLASAGLLKEKRDAFGVDYLLTSNAFPYFYGSSLFNNNRDSLPYLCFSTIAPDKILWMHRIAKPSPLENGAAQWYDVDFAWKPSARAGWADDGFLQAHSVVLAPLTSPTVAKMFYLNGQWHLVNIYDRGWMLPAVARGN